jgi:hypothetical protein
MEVWSERIRHRHIVSVQATRPSPSSPGQSQRAKRGLGAVEIVIYAQFLPEGEGAKDLVARMEDLWNIAKQA